MAAGSAGCRLVGDTTADIAPRLLYPLGTLSSASRRPIHEGDLGIVLGETGREELDASRLLGLSSMVSGVVSIRLAEETMAGVSPRN